MSFAIDLREHGADLGKLYENVISSDPETTWTIFGYDGSSNALRPEEQGSGDLDEFVDNFDDARIQYGLARVEFNRVNKVVLVGWVGENVSSRQRLTFNAHMSAVAKQFPGHHIQITARSSDELSPEIILERINAAAGSKYSGATKQAPPTKPKYVQAREGANEDDWVKVDPVEERDLTVSKNEYKSSVREELEQLRKGKKAPVKPVKDEDDNEEQKQEKSEDEEEEEERKPASKISGLDSGTSYKPVGKIDLKKIREEAKGNKFADARIEKIEPSYKPVGKVDLKAIREQARKEKQLKAGKEASEPKLKKESADYEVKEASAKQEEALSPKRDLPKRDLPERSPVSASTSTGDEDDDAPQFKSLADRMKAFQQSVNGAKPKYDTSSSSSRPSTSRSSAVSSGSKSTSSFKPTETKTSNNNDDDDEEEEEEEEEQEAPLSVAAQLAKARLSKSSDDTPPPAAPKRETPKSQEAPSSNVSSFAARFAKKEAEPQPEDKFADEDEEESEGEAESEPPKQPVRKVPEPKDKDGEEDEDVPPPLSRNRPSAAAPANEEDEGLQAVASEEYTAGDDDEISFEVGEKIVRIEKVDENWWIGENTKGEVGLFPKDYVEVEGEESDQSKSAPAASASASEPASSASKSTSEQGKTAIAQFSYEAGDDDELSIEENETITDVEFPSEDWWSGRNSKGEFGLFPSSYVTLQ